MVKILLWLIYFGAKARAPRTPARGEFIPFCPSHLAVTNSHYSLKKAMWKSREINVILREDSFPFFPMLVSMHMKFDKLPAYNYNQYFAEKVVSIFHVRWLSVWTNFPPLTRSFSKRESKSLFRGIFPFFFFSFLFFSGEFHGIRKTSRLL